MTVKIRETDAARPAPSEGVRCDNLAVIIVANASYVRKNTNQRIATKKTASTVELNKIKRIVGPRPPGVCVP
jgi:hypothetical protein